MDDKNINELKNSKKADEPEPFGAIPSPGQMKYYQEEIAVFMHFGINTFTDKEWGNGKESPTLFNPTNVNTDQWVKVFDEIGFGRLIMVAKHHDGFNIWPSKYTNHTIANSPWRNGNGDLLEEVSKSVTKYNMNMGIYLSPWDAYEPSYGEGKIGNYNEFYENQLHEILSNKKYGNNGKFDEVWMDGAKGSGAEYQEYNFINWFNIIKKYNPETVIFSPYGTDVRWVGNENGASSDPSWQQIDKNIIRRTYDNNLPEDTQYLQRGEKNGPDWSISEVDVSIRSGWFYHENQQPKSVEDLIDIYFSSVGLGSPLLLNVPADKRGLITEQDIRRLREWKYVLDKTFSKNYVENSKVSASSYRNESSLYKPENVIDADYNSYWSLNDNITSASIILELKDVVEINIIEVQEYIPLGQRITKFNIEVYSNGFWYLFGEGETIGYKRLIQGVTREVEKIRVNIIAADAVPIINKIGAYKFFNHKQKTERAYMNKITKHCLNKLDDWYLTNNGRIISSKVGAELEFTFKGTKLYINPITEQKLGKLKITIDEKDVSYLDVSKEKKYESDNLKYKHHTVNIKLLELEKVTNKDNLFQIFDIQYFDNHNKGFISFKQKHMHIKNNNSVCFTVNRLAGSKGDAEVIFQTLPGTAVHGKHYQDKTIKLIFKDGEKQKNVEVNIFKDRKSYDNLYFFVELKGLTDEVPVQNK